MWFLYRHKERPEIRYWTRRTGEGIEIRSPRNVAGHGGEPDPLMPPPLSARSGLFPVSAFSGSGALYEPVRDERGRGVISNVAIP